MQGRGPDEDDDDDDGPPDLVDTSEEEDEVPDLVSTPEDYSDDEEEDETVVTDRTGTSLTDLPDWRCPLVQTLVLDDSPVHTLRKSDLEKFTSLRSISLVRTRVAYLHTVVSALGNVTTLRDLSFRSAPATDAKETEKEAHQRRLSTIRRALDEEGEMVDEDDVVSAFAQRITALAAVIARAREEEEEEEEEGERETPVCGRFLYREFLVCHLPMLKTLDGVEISEGERERAEEEVRKRLDHPWSAGELGVSGQLWRREVESGVGARSKRRWEEALEASCSCSLREPVWRQVECRPYFEGALPRTRPRQFEYSLYDPCQLVCGSMDGDTLLIDHEEDCLLARGESRLHGRVLALSWIPQSARPGAWLAGTDHGDIALFRVPEDRWASRCDDSAIMAKRADFPSVRELTSVHGNCTGTLAVASGYTHDVTMFDLDTAKVSRVWSSAHGQHINVVKFGEEDPNLFVSSSFDGNVAMWDVRVGSDVAVWRSPACTAGVVMVVWSPDGRRVLTSGVDNDIREFCAADGRQLLAFDLRPKESPNNFTRSYYMNHGSHVLSGSCEDRGVRVLSTSTGKLVQEVEVVAPIEDPEVASSLYVQSLRGSPFQSYHLSCLAGLPDGQTFLLKTNLFGA